MTCLRIDDEGVVADGHDQYFTAGVQDWLTDAGRHTHVLLLWLGGLFGILAAALVVAYRLGRLWRHRQMYRRRRADMFRKVAELDKRAPEFHDRHLLRMNEIAAGIGYSSYAKLLDHLRYLASREVFYSADTETARAELASIGRQLHELDMLLMVYVINDIQPGRRGPLPQWRRLSDAASDNYTAHQIEEVWDKIGRFRRASFYWD